MGFKDVPPAENALWAEYGGCIIFVTPGEFAGQHKKLPVQIVVCFVGFLRSQAVYASFSGTAQSPEL